MENELIVRMLKEFVVETNQKWIHPDICEKGATAIETLMVQRTQLGASVNTNSPGRTPRYSPLAHSPDIAPFLLDFASYSSPARRRQSCRTISQKISRTTTMENAGWRISVRQRMLNMERGTLTMKIRMLENVRPDLPLAKPGTILRAGEEYWGGSDSGRSPTCQYGFPPIPRKISRERGLSGVELGADSSSRSCQLSFSPLPSEYQRQF